MGQPIRVQCRSRIPQRELSRVQNFEIHLVLLDITEPFLDRGRQVKLTVELLFQGQFQLSTKPQKLAL